MTLLVDARAVIGEYGQQWVDAKRHPDYFDKQNAGYFDAIRWRYISDDNTAFQALLNGEIDFFERVKSEDYFGAATSASFTKETLCKTTREPKGARRRRARANASASRSIPT